MPRGPRIDFPGLLHHVMFRGHNRMDIFRDDDDREELLGRLNDVVVESKARVYAWVFMSNHVHLLIRTNSKAKLSDVIKRIKGVFRRPAI